MPMRKSKRFDSRITEETAEQIRALAILWGGPVRQLSQAETVDEAVRRCYAAEQKKIKKAVG